MLKLVFWLLLAINIVVFATTLDQSDTVRPSIRIQNPEPVSPEKIRILAASQSFSPDFGSDGKNERLQTNCVEIGNFNLQDAETFEKKMALPPGMINRITVDTASSYMVFSPPSKNSKMAERKIAELQERGISHYFFIPDGKFRYAISLGIFKTEDSARKLVAELKKHGIHDASIAGRGKITQGIAFQVNNPDDHQLDRINDLLDTYPQITSKSCQQPGEVVQ